MAGAAALVLPDGITARDARLKINAHLHGEHLRSGTLSVHGVAVARDDQAVVLLGPGPVPGSRGSTASRAGRASFAEIARTYRVSPDAVRRQPTARGIRAPRGAPRLRGVSAAEVAALYERGGLSVAQIAARYGVSRWLVGARLAEAGVARRPRAHQHARRVRAENAPLHLALFWPGAVARSRTSS